MAEPGGAAAGSRPFAGYDVPRKWEDIRKTEADFPSPVWHGEELAKTQQRRDAGLEEPLDWDVAKEKLRKRKNEP